MVFALDMVLVVLLGTLANWASTGTYSVVLQHREL